MKLVAIPILIMLLLTQTFSKWFVVMVFNLNRETIAKNLCENRARPKLNCKGNCVLMKKMKQEEKQEQKSSGLVKVDLATTVISSRSFFAAAPSPVVETDIRHFRNRDSNKPVDRAFAIFHPPAA